MTANLNDYPLLMIEDNADNAQLARWILEDAGFCVDVATSAEAGFAKLAERNYSLVLMDISLPGMDGKEAIKKMKRSPDLSAIPVIAVTAHAILNERDAILKSGANGIVTKPLDECSLLQDIQTLLKLPGH